MAEQVDVQLATLARDAATTSARSITWFTELVDGQGRARGMDDALRDVLMLASAEAATEQAAQTRVQQQRQRDSEREQDRAKRQERSQHQRALDRAITAGAFSALWGRFWAALVIVGLTPVAASFATLVPVLGDKITPVVFLPGQGGNTSGSGPFMLYRLLAITVGVCLIAAFASDLTLGKPRDLASGLVLGCGWGSLAIFGVQWWFGTLVSASWVIAPALITMGYLIGAVSTGTRRRLARGVQMTLSAAKSGRS